MQATAQITVTTTVGTYDYKQVCDEAAAKLQKSLNPSQSTVTCIPGPKNSSDKANEQAEAHGDYAQRRSHRRKILTLSGCRRSVGSEKSWRGASEISDELDPDAADRPTTPARAFPRPPTIPD
jgi:hypothetical protein